MTVLLVALGGAIGAVARYATGRLTLDRPAWATFAVNVVGSFVLGLLAGAGVSGRWGAFASIGFCGAFTTWSTLAYETRTLGWRWGAVNAGASLVVGVGAAALGYAVTV